MSVSRAEHLLQNTDRLHGVDRVQVVTVVGQQSLQKSAPLCTVESYFGQATYVALHHIAQDTCAFLCHKTNVLRPSVGIKSLSEIDPIAGRVVVARAKTQETAQVGQEPEVEIGHPLDHRIERPDTVPHKIE